ncbi:unnamed protein product [Clonostachys byssicola]|uniref:N-acetyltransferase domain-containing protein n=1 Tax=Clonostachys byssicola TaxID=160290 RepID=A0A9N9UQZ3_9HYPO|nr:unnamed protein product [Clonostachys byssicola]
MTGHFHIRNAEVSFNDAQFIIDAFDSTLPHLAAAGNIEQWGTKPFSKRAGFAERIEDMVAKSESFYKTGTGHPVRVFIAEVEDDPGTASASTTAKLARRVDVDGKALVAVSFAIVLDERFVSYLQESESLKNHVGAALEKGNFVFLWYLVTDHRVIGKHRGAGNALIERVKHYASDHGRQAVWVDCWDGGNGLLVKYYVDRHFEIVEGFTISDTKNGTTWKGKLLRLDLS